jgi:hypothetical protein
MGYLSDDNEELQSACNITEKNLSDDSINPFAPSFIPSFQPTGSSRSVQLNLTVRVYRNYYNTTK